MDIATVAGPIGGGALALLIAFYLSPILIKTAHRYGIVDKPKPPLKVHGEPVAYLGGLVVFLALVFSIAVVLPLEQRVLAILFAASLVVSLGLIDDLGTLSPRDKMIGQAVAAIVLVRAGVEIEIAAVPSPLDEALSVFWLLVCMNAFNILDVSDGLAATAGVVGAAACTAVALLTGESQVATMAAAMGGACLGFLRVNREPARMYLGDTGSMLIGLVLGSLAMVLRYSEHNTVSAWLMPLAICAAPLFDLALVIVARLLQGRPIWQGSPDHVAVRLRHNGWRARSIARAAGALGAFIAALAVVSTRLPNQAALIVAAALMLTAFTLMGVLLIVVQPRRAEPAPAPSQPGGPA